MPHLHVSSGSLAKWIIFESNDACVCISNGSSVVSVLIVLKLVLYLFSFDRRKFVFAKLVCFAVRSYFEACCFSFILSHFEIQLL